MNNEKEIERILEIANEATANCKVCTDCKFRINGDCCNRKVGEAIADANYGSVKQAVKEFAEKLKAQIQKQADDYYSGKSVCPELGVDEETIDRLFLEFYVEGKEKTV